MTSMANIIHKTLSLKTGRQYRLYDDGWYESRVALGQWSKSRRRVAPGATKQQTIDAFYARMKHREFRTNGVQPSNREMEKWAFDGVCETPDGCRTEPDGSCPHGYKSWLILAGLI